MPTAKPPPKKAGEAGPIFYTSGGLKGSPFLYKQKTTCETFFCPPKTSFYYKFPEKFPCKNVYTCRRGTVPCPPTGAYPHPFLVIPDLVGEDKPSMFVSLVIPA